MTGRDIIKNLHEGRRVFSSAIVATSPLWPNLAKQAGIDFVFVDTEHTPLDRETLSWTCQTYNALGVPPVVRLPCNDPFEACKVLDAGAGGVIGPDLGTADHAPQLGGAGIHYWLDVELEIAWSKAGGNLVMHSSDLATFSRTLKSEIGELRKRLEGA